MSLRVKAFEIFFQFMSVDFITGWTVVYGGWIPGYTRWDTAIPAQI